MAASSGLFVVATATAGALDDRCRLEPLHLGALEMVTLLALPTPPDLLATLAVLALSALSALSAVLALLAAIVWYACSGNTRWKRRLDVAPSLLMVSLVCAFAVAYVAGWYDACGMLSLRIVASLASVGAVLSGVMFGVYMGVCRAPGKWPFWNLAAPVLVMAVAAFAYHALQVADVREAMHEVVRQLLATFAMAVVAVMVGVFSAEYGKNPGQSLRWCWALSFVLMAVGIAAYAVPSGADVRPVVYGVDIQECVAQVSWAGSTMLMALMARDLTPRGSTKFLSLWMILMAVVSFHAGVLSDIQSKYVTLPPDAVATAWVGSWQLWVGLGPAFLGPILADRMGTERDGAPPRRTADDARNGTAGPPRPIRLCYVARRDDKWGMLRPYAMRQPPHMP